MKKFAFIIMLAVGTTLFGQEKAKSAKSPAEFVPAGYVVFQKIQGDLNGDRRADCVFIIKGTDPGKIVEDESGAKLDRNRRGIIVVLSNRNGYELALENRQCFSSENEDGGVYFPPELSVSIRKGNLRLHFSHGRYGYWSYDFRRKKSDFELIGYDISEDRGPVIERSVSINLVTRKMRIRENVNADAEGGDEEFEESWKTFTLSKPIRLGEIPDFDGFDVESILVPRE